jgi:PAP2 superfamily
MSVGFLRFAPALTSFTLAGVLSVPQLFAVDAVVHWNKVATDATAAAGIDSPAETRIYAIMHIAIHDALNAMERRYQPYLFRQSVPGNVPDAVVAAAAREVLLALVPGQKNAVEAAYSTALGAAPGSEAAKASGASTGRLAAMAILSERMNDGSASVVQVTPGQGPGEWRPTGPEFFPAFKAQWGSVKPFGLRSSSQFRPDPPFEVNSPEFVSSYEEVRKIGSATSTTRTDEQSMIARYWYENSSQGWNRIARTVSEQTNQNTWANGRLFALVNTALADGYIASWEAKYFYNFWRPVTAITGGETDGNPETVADPSWSSFLFTPPIPDYPSGHATVGSAAARALEHFFENDFVTFSMTSGAPYPGITRRFWSFSEAAHENAASRVLAGIHFWHASRGGIRQGEQIADHLSANLFRPVR